ncbi:hypothetical protein GLE_1887 [Lysobacter enzymogenes]|uniref:Uncharacterized protein n=1 Tax=Lysobacter enzymogenes TaxID=69 RepID=A0A0S2DF79_LYSEN|nr:DUF1508 domain-containing protein [Lysobacter enzymogenes]ALN57239.1 hypothetical protein GLE_1887 [Lysobacter enzymogenes]QCW25893.1 DUF1508 domain-containing protein [Lysobacter enzymogenes]UZW58999.1 DUF1508 domain-containing protein [Lysobacter enzymogenes]
MRFEIYRKGDDVLGNTPGTEDPYTWRLLADNDDILATGEGYANKTDCYHAINLVKSATTQTLVVDFS